MAFKQDGYATVWKIEDKGNYTNVQLSTSKKNKLTDKYETDFSAMGVRFIGTAHKEASTLSEKDRIKIGSCEVSNNYDKEKKITYTNYCVFSFEKADDTKPVSKTETKTETKAKTVEKPAETTESEEQLPF